MLRRILDSPWPYFVGAGLLLAIAVASQVDVQIRSRPQGTAADIPELRERDGLNVVFVLIDTLRADRLGIYGYERPTSPTIDDLARHGIVFKQVTAQSSWTKSSMASLWTGTLPANNGMLRYNHALPEEAMLPAEIFQEAATFVEIFDCVFSASGTLQRLAGQPQCSRAQGGQLVGKLRTLQRRLQRSLY